MTPGLVHSLFRQVRGSPDPDADLLRRFAEHRDEAAFGELLGRHGPLVWGVCRRVLPNRADAEDAFQATFLVLARKARTVLKPGSLGCWLYGVANRVARRMRGRAVATATDAGVELPARAEPALDVIAAREALAALDEELLRLPERYRRPLILCFLQERTQDEAAEQLGMSRSTLKRRVALARERLRQRLAGRGLDLAVVLAAAGVSGVLPERVAAAAVGAAVGGGVSGPVGAITREVLFAMWRTKAQAWVVGILLAGGLTTGVGHYAATGFGQTFPPEGKSPPPVPATAPTPPKPTPPPAPAPAVAPAQMAEFQTKVELAQIELQLAELKIREAQTTAAQVSALRKAATVSQSESDAAQAGVERAKLEGQRAKVNLEAAKMILERAKRADAVASDEAALLKQLEVESQKTGRLSASRAVSADVQTLRDDKFRVARRLLDIGYAVGRTGNPASTVYQASRRVLESEREVDPSLSNWSKYTLAHFIRMKNLEARLAKVDAISESEKIEATYYRLEAEIWMKEAETAATPAKSPAVTDKPGRTSPTP